MYSQAFHFWDGPGRSDGAGTDEGNFYENYAEDTKGKRRPDAGVELDLEQLQLQLQGNALEQVDAEVQTELDE